MTYSSKYSGKIAAAALLASGLFAAGLAQAQSHSVVNYSNPPNVQADSKAATDATPGLTATADQQDANHPNKGAKDAAANKGSAKSAKKQRHASKGPQQRPARPWAATHSAYQGPSAVAKVTRAKRCPSMQAVSMAASAIPTTGRSNSSRAPNRPGSPKAAIIAAPAPS